MDRSAPQSSQIRSMESLPGPMPDVQDFNQLLFFDDAVDYPINVRFVAVKEVPDCFFLGCYGTPVWQLFQTENLPLQTLVPFSRGVGFRGVDLSIKLFKVTRGTESNVNDLYHAGIRTLQKTRSPAGLFLLWNPPVPDGYPPLG